MHYRIRHEHTRIARETSYGLMRLTFNVRTSEQNCRTLSNENPYQGLKMPLHSLQVTVWIGFTTSFLMRPFFGGEFTYQGPKTCFVTAPSYRDTLQGLVIPEL